jgi:putative nucleotidyltransferase with HDIG domain
MEQASASTQPVMRSYAHRETLVKAGEPLGPEQLDLLRREHAQVLAERSLPQRILRAAVVVGMSFTMLMLCGLYMRYRQRGPLASVGRLVALLGLLVVAVGLAKWAAAEPWRAELVPLLLFGMTMTIVYRQQLALVFTAVAALLIVVAIGGGLRDFILLLGVAMVANLNLGTIRSRRKLIYVGVFAGGVAFVLHVALALLDDHALSWTLLSDALRSGFWTLAASFLMTGLLPFIEQFFGVLTDLSLLELGDAAHPLLQELVRRAPSTYNHSLTVGSIAEAAAESVGARGLLVRVAAYFHDIGKMLKPGYFVENQAPDENLHESLLPAMSSLVIIAHVKDGIDLARQHRLPQPLIDLIAQHHGTTLVEYFYDRAHEQQQADPNGGEVDESVFRYPGPKPQTKEAAVLMLADAVESATRTLVDPTSARIEAVVHSIAERRLDEGQFDESGLTLRELRTIERSMVISLVSIYHARIKYPEPAAARP